MSESPKMGQQGWVEPAKLWDFLREMYHAAQGPKPSEQVTGDSLTPDYLSGFKDGVDYAEAKVSTATERLVRGHVADRLAAICSAGRWAPGPSWTLEDALCEVEVAIRLARAQDGAIADRLRDILFKCEAQPAWELDELLHEADRRLNRGAPPLGNPPPSIVRDAANQNTAAILATMLGMKSPPADGWDLPKALTRVKEALGDSTARAQIRDAALEEAAQECVNNLHKFVSHYHWPDRIRALKSKPATLSGVDYGPKPDVTRVSVLEVRDIPPEPVHDFGWALQQMRAGKKVRRMCWKNGQNVWSDNHPTNPAMYDETGSFAQVVGYGVLATDWEVFE